MLEHILELARLPAHVVDDRVDHDVMRLGEFGDVVPVAEPRIDLRVVDRVEAGVGAVEGREERQDVHAFVDTVETGAQDVGQRGEVAVAETIRVGDELYFVLHEFLLVESVAVGQSHRWDQSVEPKPRNRIAGVASNRFDTDDYDTDGTSAQHDCAFGVSNRFDN